MEDDMSKPKLYTLRALLALEAAAAVVFTPTQRAIKLIPLLAAAWLAVEAVNGVKKWSHRAATTR